MSMYADFEYYRDVYKGKLDEEEAVKALKKASRHIDTLTFNRLKGAKLSDFQEEVVRETCCMMCDFETDNEDIINNLLSSYSLNGASMSFSGRSAGATVVNGIVIQKDVYSYLCQTGFCCLSLGV